MAENNKIIHNAVRMSDGEVYDKGREDELAKAMSSEQLKRLTDEGAIEGFGATAKNEPKDEPKKGK